MVSTPGSGGATLIERLVGDTGEPERVLPAARAIGRRLLEGVQAALTESFGEPLAMELGGAAIDRMGSLVAAAGPLDAATVSASAASPDALALRIDPMAAAILLNAMFGAGDSSAVAPIEREFSAIEMDAADALFRKFAVAFNASVAPALHLKLPIPAALTGAELKKLPLRDGPAARLDFVVGVAPVTGRVTVLLPQRIVLRAQDGLAADDPGKDAAAGEWAARFNEEVMRSTVTLEATMPLGRMTLGAIAAMHDGQVIEMPASAPTETRLSARNKTLFVCEFGRLGQHYTVRIKNAYDPGAEAAEGASFQ